MGAAQGDCPKSACRLVTGLALRLLLDLIDSLQETLEFVPIRG